MNTKIEKVIIISFNSENCVSDHEFIVFWNEIMFNNNQNNVNDEMLFSTDFESLSEWTLINLRRSKWNHNKSKSSFKETEKMYFMSDVI